MILNNNFVEYFLVQPGYQPWGDENSITRLKNQLSSDGAFFFYRLMGNCDTTFPDDNIKQHPFVKIFMDINTEGDMRSLVDPQHIMLNT